MTETCWNCLGFDFPTFWSSFLDEWLLGFAKKRLKLTLSCCLLAKLPFPSSPLSSITAKSSSLPTIGCGSWGDELGANILSSRKWFRPEMVDLHKGQLEQFWSHKSMQFKWNAWLHFGRTLNNSCSWNSVRHTTHLQRVLLFPNSLLLYWKVGSSRISNSSSPWFCHKDKWDVDGFTLGGVLLNEKRRKGSACCHMK